MILQKLTTILFVLFLANIPVSKAIDLGGGLSLLEEGDDIFKTGISLHLGISKWFGRGFLFTRKFGPVTQRTYLVDLNRKLELFKIFGSNIFEAGLGLSLMNEQTLIRYSNEDGEKNLSENSLNLGGVIGIHLNRKFLKRYFVQAGWESHIFFAGQAAILMSTGRKQTLSILIGTEI